MRLRKINAVLSLIATVLLLDHAIFLGAWMLSRGAIHKTANDLPWVMTGVMAVHAIISIALAVRGHKGAEKRKCNSYPGLNAATMVQRISGMLMIVFTFLHITGATGVMHTPPLVHAIVPPLFFLLVMAHVAVSANKAFITLGIGNAKFVKVAGVAIKVICVATLVADVIGFYLFVC